ncbi:hypothetical protein PYCC9005_000451 [Savitreella phatthalungensis]
MIAASAVLLVAYIAWLEHRLLYVPLDLRRLCRPLRDRPTEDDVSAGDARYASAIAATCTHASTYIVTGGSGMTGAAIVRALLHRAPKATRIRILDLRPPPPDLAKLEAIEFVQCDVSDREAVVAAFLRPWSGDGVEGVDVVYHTAGNIRFWEGLEWQMARSEKVLVDGTRWVIEGCVKAGAQVLVYTSSGSILGRFSDFANPFATIKPTIIQDGEPVADMDQMSNYSRGKARAEGIVLAETRLRTGALRPAHAVYGSGGYSAGVVWGDREGAVFGNVHVNPRPAMDKVVDLVYVDNLAYACLLMEKRLMDVSSAEQLPPADRRFLVTNHEPVTWREFYKLQQSYWPTVNLGYCQIYPVALLYLLGLFGTWCVRAWHALTGKQLELGTLRFLSPQGWSHGQATGVYDVRRAKEILGYQPPYSVAEGVRKMCELEAASRSAAARRRERRGYNDF